MNARMSAKEAIAVVHRSRDPRDIVVTTMNPARDWMALGMSDLDMVLVPSAMSHAPSMGLGLAMAQPTRRVIVCNGDGSMLMNLGSLASIVNAQVKNLVLLVFDNGTYEVTGSQPVPAAGTIDYAAVARGCGFRSVYEFSDLDEWTRRAGEIVTTDGPTFVWLKVEPVYGLPGPRSPGPAKERARRFMTAVRQTMR